MYLVIDDNPTQKPVNPSIERKELIATWPRSWGVGIFKAKAFDSGVVNRAMLFLKVRSDCVGNPATRVFPDFPLAMKRNEKRSGSERWDLMSRADI
jgi:hypothetical protein